MSHSDQSNLFLASTVAPPTVSQCDTINPCSQSCVSSTIQEKSNELFADFAAPSQQQNGTQTFHAAPSFLC